MKLTIEISDQTAQWLMRRAAKLGPSVKIETIAASLLEQASRQRDNQGNRQQGDQDKHGE